MVLYCTVLQYILQMHTHPTVTHSRGRRILKIQDSSHKVCSDSENVNTAHFIRIQSVYTKSVGKVMDNNPQSRKWFGLFVCAHDLNWLANGNYTDLLPCWWFHRLTQKCSRFAYIEFNVTTMSSGFECKSDTQLLCKQRNKYRILCLRIRLESGDFPSVNLIKDVWCYTLSIFSMYLKS